jgi:hypothetical protein
MAKIIFELDSFYTATDLIEKLKEGDGAGSGFDADLLDGQHASYFLPAGTYTAADILTKLLTVDGAGSGLDADKLDGVELAKILALGAAIPGSANLNNYTATGLYNQPSTANATSGTNYPVALAGMLEVIADGSIIYQKYTAYDSAHFVYLRTYENGTWYSWTRVLDTTDLTTINNNLALKLNASVYTADDILSKLLTVDGSGSGLDADTLDGTHLATLNSAINAKLNASIYTATDILTKLKTVDGSTSGLDADLLDGQEGAYYLPASSYSANDVLTKLKTVDGPGSGLDADTVDGGTPSATGGTANAIVKAGSNGLIDNAFLPMSPNEGTFQVPKLIEAKTGISGGNNLDFTGLNGNADGIYLVQCALSLSANDAAVYMLPNSSTANGLSNGIISSSSVDHSKIDTNYAFMIANTLYNNSHGAEGVCLGRTEILAPTGKRRVSTSCQSSTGTSLVNLSVTSHWTNTSANITSLRAYVSSGTMSGWIKLYKMVDLVIS